jgi:hypothetical protein
MNGKTFKIRAGDVGSEAYRDEYVHRLERELAAVTAERDALRGRLLGIADIFDAAASGADAVGFHMMSDVYRQHAASCRDGAASARIQADMVRGLDMVEKALNVKDEAGQ